MAKLETEHQVFIVQALARFLTPTDVVEAVKAEFGIQVDRRQVQFYDPTKGGSEKRLSENWKHLYEKSRAEFISSVGSIGISHQAYRLTELHEMAREARRLKNYALAAQLLEQAAKERGGQYTNKVKVQVQDKRERLAQLVQTTKEQLPETVH